jgi:type IV pilus assembly protein PilY1
VQQAACVSCVNSNGYWLNPNVPDNDVSNKAGVFSTNWLRFNPPKWTLLSLAYKRLVNGPLLSILREAVVATNNKQGGTVVQMMLPQSCNGQGRPLSQKLKAIDNLSYTSDANPLAEMLFNTAWYMGGQELPWFFSTPVPTAMQQNKSGPCDNCGGDFAVLFSDGRGDSANPACTKNPSGQVAKQCSVAASCDTLGMGSEDDGNDFIDPSLVGGVGAAITGTSVRQTPGGTCSMDFADDVAGWMRNNSVSVGNNTAKIRTYVVAIGDSSNVYGELSTLQAIAQAGGTNQPIYADDFRSLERGIEDIINRIITNSTSFSAAAVPAVQTQGYTSAFIPRFRPGDGPQWSGTLTRFQLFNEFAAGCTPGNYGNNDGGVNPNMNKSCFDVYLRDKNGSFVGETSTGDFALVDDNAAWDGGWPLKSTGVDGGFVPAVPIWEASDRLTTREDALISAGNDGGTATNVTPRKIYTVAPNGGSGGYSTTLIDFTLANASTITPLLQLGGVNGDFCTSLASYTRHTYTTDDDCTSDVIRFVHGEDILRKNPYNRQDPQPAIWKSRPNILGDIFHSTPVLVTPPVAPFICDLGIANQCVSSLYQSTLTPGGTDAYGTYAANNAHRAQFILVAANDGMLHAFNAGNAQVDSDGGVSGFDLGTGDELWAFIPPDILPKLIRYAIGERHELLVDGTPMVRDIWVDGSGKSSTTRDGVKQADEYHTVAVVGEREGGRSYFGLDVTDPNAPRFLWSAPPPGSSDAFNQGETWNDLGPAAPPIGPIAEKDANGPFKANGTQARERYIVAVGGGYDPAYIRGRSISMLDAWTGQQIYRFAAVDSTSTSDPRSALAPVAAPVSLIDSNSDGLFDTAVVGDTNGQVWTLSMYSPGEDTTSDGRYDNWVGARAFIQFNKQAFSLRSPFFQRAVAALVSTSPPVIRILLGSGDRDNIKEPNGGMCGVANLSSCIRKGCKVTTTAAMYRTGPAPAGSSGGHTETGTSWSYTPGAQSPATTLALDSTATSSNCNDVDDATLSFSITCGGTAQTFTSSVYCDWGATSGVDGGVECPNDQGRILGEDVDYTPGTAVEYSYFYSFKLFDPGLPNSSTRTQFTTSTAATAYDGAALTDANLADASTTACAASGCATSMDNGWRLKHQASLSDTPPAILPSDERTASSALLLGGCTFWNTLKPNPSTTVACGATSLPADSAYSYQADAVSGSIQCGSNPNTLARFTKRDTHVAPTQQSGIVSVNKQTGEIAYSAVSIDPGSPPSATSVGTGNILGPLHWLEVSRGVHDCRHGGNCN